MAKLERRPPQEIQAYYAGLRYGIRLYSWEDENGKKWVGQYPHQLELKEAIKLADGMQRIAELGEEPST